MFRALPSPAVLLIGSIGITSWCGGCGTPLGPGYAVQREEIQVSFSQQPEPRITVAADYQLKNAGNQPLPSLSVRVPGRRFQPRGEQALWDGVALEQTSSPESQRDTLLRFPRAWATGESHTLRISYQISSQPEQGGARVFSPDAFCLPAETWTPELPQPRGLFGFGGVPPKKWNLIVRLPREFLVHASGTAVRHSPRQQKEDLEYRFEQSTNDLMPFVVAGLYRETLQKLAPKQEIRVWSRGAASNEENRAAISLSQTILTYDSLFGAREKAGAPLYIVECPASAGCILTTSSAYSALLYGQKTNPSAELISSDTVLVDPQVPEGELNAAIGPALAAGWLGYGRNPGFYEQQPPMSALPAFAAAMAQERASGTPARDEIIGRALAEIPPRSSAGNKDGPDVIRAKSLLLFYALRDRVGAEVFQKAMRHMLAARQGRGFEVADLISALEQESDQSVGPFVRQWIKQPGVPDDFRLRYSQFRLQKQNLAQEATQ